MTFGPLEFAAYLRRRQPRGFVRETAGDTGADLGNQLTVISGPHAPTPMPREADTLCADVLEEMAWHSPPTRTSSD